MTEYVALLGRINVGGHTVRMADLREIVGELGYDDIGTYIQTGNVFFRSAKKEKTVEQELRKHLTERLGYDVPTFVRSVGELEEAARADGFEGIDLAEDTRHVVLHLSAPLPENTDYPVEDAKKGFKLVGSHGRDAFLVLTLVKGRPGNVTPWIEKQFGVEVTARFAHTLAKLLDAAAKHFSA